MGYVLGAFGMLAFLSGVVGYVLSITPDGKTHALLLLLAGAILLSAEGIIAAIKSRK